MVGFLSIGVNITLRRTSCEPPFASIFPSSSISLPSTIRRQAGATSAITRSTSSTVPRQRGRIGFRKPFATHNRRKHRLRRHTEDSRDWNTKGCHFWRRTSEPRREAGSKCSRRKGSAGALRPANAVGSVNLTPQESQKIITGVAPSGSSKMKAWQEQEANEKERRRSQTAEKMSFESGVDLEKLRASGIIVHLT
ncbi:hypothetical protein MMC07_007727 [Pseudocyphellaria aurata]|nr:hypothetical protein [Pseudocyphellaria aurata]